MQYKINLKTMYANQVHKITHTCCTTKVLVNHRGVTNESKKGKSEMNTVYESRYNGCRHGMVIVLFDKRENTVKYINNSVIKKW